MKCLYIRMLGEFSLQFGENKISDSSNRSKKVWLLLAYLICQKGRVVSRKELIHLLWGDDPASNTPENTLKITFHRARQQLDQLWPSAGHDLILRQGNGYTWNTEIPMEIDMERFESLCQDSPDDEEKQLQSFLSALELYHGDFLSRFSSESWIIPVATHFHNLYVQTILATCPLLFARARHEEAAAICHDAINLEPYHEPLHQQLMQALLNMGNQKGAIAVYNELSQRLFDDFSIKPTSETRALYHAASQHINLQFVPMDMVMNDMHEADSPSGAMECEYDFFRILCFAEARSMLRSGKATHIALLSVTGKDGVTLNKRSQDRAVENLQELIRMNLRRGDAFTRCSACQFILLLPCANYENSCMVSQRVITAFRQKYPHSPANILFVVQPLAPFEL